MDIIYLDKLTSLFYSLNNPKPALHLHITKEFPIEAGMVSWKLIEEKNFLV